LLGGRNQPCALCGLLKNWKTLIEIPEICRESFTSRLDHDLFDGISIACVLSAKLSAVESPAVCGFSNPASLRWRTAARCDLVGELQ
jgi:hypothetical protein